MENKQTAVEWFRSELTRCHTATDERIAFRVAKLMEKEQIEDAYNYGYLDYTINMNENAEQYYNETYNKQDNDKI